MGLNRNREAIPDASAFRLASGLGARRCVLQRQFGGFRTLALFPGHQFPQFVGAVHRSARMRVFGLPLPQILEHAVEVVTGLARQLVFDAPDFLENRKNE